MAKAFELNFDAKLGPYAQGVHEAALRNREFEKELRKVARAAKDASHSTDEQGQQSEKAKKSVDQMEMAVGRLYTQLASIAGPSAIGAAFIRFLNDMQAESEAAREALQAQLDTARQLAQVSSTAGETRIARLEAEQVALESGMSVANAQQLLFSARSFGLNAADTKTLGLTQLFSTEGGPERFMSGVGKFQSIFGSEMGDARQLVSAFLAAGAPSDVASDIIAQQAVQAAPFVKKIGGTGDELLGVLSVLSRMSKSPEEAAVGIKNIAAQIDRAGYGGQGLLGGLAAWDAADRADLEEKMQSEIMAGAAFEKIAQAAGLIQQRELEVATARRSGSMFDQTIAAAKLPDLQEATLGRRLEIARELSDTQKATAKQRTENMQMAVEVLGEEAERQYGATAGNNRFTRWVTRKEGELAQWAFGEQAAQNFLGGQVGVGPNGVRQWYSKPELGESLRGRAGALNLTQEDVLQATLDVMGGTVTAQLRAARAAEETARNTAQRPEQRRVDADDREHLGGR